VEGTPIAHTENTTHVGKAARRLHSGEYGTLPGYEQVLFPRGEPMFITFQDLAGLAVCGVIVTFPFILLGAMPPIILVFLAVLFVIAMWAEKQ